MVCLKYFVNDSLPQHKFYTENQPGWVVTNYTLRAIHHRIGKFKQTEQKWLWLLSYCIQTRFSGGEGPENLSPALPKLYTWQEWVSCNCTLQKIILIMNILIQLFLSHILRYRIYERYQLKRSPCFSMASCALYWCSFTISYQHGYLGDKQPLHNIQPINDKMEHLRSAKVVLENHMPLAVAGCQQHLWTTKEICWYRKQKVKV